MYGCLQSLWTAHASWPGGKAVTRPTADKTLLSRSSVHENLGSQCLVAMNEAAIKIPAPDLGEPTFAFLLDKYLGKERLGGSSGGCKLNTVRNFQKFSKVVVPCHAHDVCEF